MQAKAILRNSISLMRILQRGIKVPYIHIYSIYKGYRSTYCTYTRYKSSIPLNHSFHPGRHTLLITSINSRLRVARILAFFFSFRKNVKSIILIKNLLNRTNSSFVTFDAKHAYKSVKLAYEYFDQPVVNFETKPQKLVSVEGYVMRGIRIQEILHPW